MNDVYGVDPEAFENSQDVRTVLQQFGPFAGRYVGMIPASWHSRVLAHIKTWSNDNEKYRAGNALAEIKNKKVTVNMGPAAAKQCGTWTDTYQRVKALRPEVVNAIVPRGHHGPFLPIDELDLDPVAGGQMNPTASEFARICQFLLRHCTEAACVDRYFDVCLGHHGNVMQSLLQLVADSNCREFAWYTDNDRDPDKRPRPREFIEASFKRRCIAARISNTKRVRLVYLDKDKFQTMFRLEFHPRFLLTRDGGIMFDKGFQEGRLGDRPASVMHRETHEKVVPPFLHRKDDLLQATRFEVSWP